MKIRGNIIMVLEPKTGQGKNGTWKKQEFVIETLEKYPKRICIALWNDKIDAYLSKIGQVVDVDITIESKEYMGKWYTEINTAHIEKVENLEDINLKKINFEQPDDNNLPF